MIGLFTEIAALAAVLVFTIVTLRLNSLSGLPAKIAVEMQSCEARLQHRLERVEDKLDRHMEQHAGVTRLETYRNRGGQ